MLLQEEIIGWNTFTFKWHPYFEALKGRWWWMRFLEINVAEVFFLHSIAATVLFLEFHFHFSFHFSLLCFTISLFLSLFLFSVSLFLFSGGCDSSKSMFWKYFSCTEEPAINSNSLITGCDKTLQYPLLPQNTTRLGGSHPIMGRTLWLNFIGFDTGCFSYSLVPPKKLKYGKPRLGESTLM